MSKWEMVRLGDLCSKVASVSSGDTNEIIDYIDISSVDNENKIITGYNTLDLKDAPSRARQKVRANDILVSTVRPNLNAVAIVNESSNSLIASTGFCVLRCDEKSLDSRYAFSFCKSRKFISSLTKIATGASYPAVNDKNIFDLTIPLPPLDEQKRIAAMLDKAQALIDLRKKQLAEMDLMVKSRFIEMFGDPFQNDKDFEIKVGQEFFKLSNGKPVPEEKRKSCGISAFGGNGVSWYTDEVLYEKDTLVVGRVGFQSGNVHLAKGPLWVTDNAMYMSECNTNEFELVFLGTLMEHIDFTRFQDAGDLKKVTQKPFMQMSYICPPLSLQKEFVAFVAQTDKSKFLMQEGLKKLEFQYKALMQQFFS